MARLQYIHIKFFVKKWSKCRNSAFGYTLSKYVSTMLSFFYAKMKMMMSQWLLFHTTAFFGSNIITIIIKYGHEMRRATPEIALATV